MTTDPRYTVGARVLIVGHTPHTGESGEVRQVNPVGYLGSWYANQNIYHLRLDNGTDSIQAEGNLTAVEVKRRRGKR